MIAAEEVLQAHVAPRGKRQRFTGETTGSRLRGGRRLDEVVMREEIGDAGKGFLPAPLWGRAIGHYLSPLPGRGSSAHKVGRRRPRKFMIQQPVGVIEGRPQHLTAGEILEGRGNP